MITNVRRTASRIPIEKETWPTVVMHRFCVAWGWHRDFENTHKFILENNFVAVRRGLHSIEAIGKTGFVLPVDVKISRGQPNKTQGHDDDKS
jgi:hypothetical protein